MFVFVSSSVSSLPEEGTIVRSKKLLERRARNRRAPKPNGLDNESSYLPQKSNPKKKMRQGFDNDDALQLFLWGPETKQLLTAKEEAELIAHIQVCVCVCVFMLTNFFSLMLTNLLMVIIISEFDKVGEGED